MSFSFAYIDLIILTIYVLIFEWIYSCIFGVDVQMYGNWLRVSTCGWGALGGWFEWTRTILDCLTCEFYIYCLLYLKIKKTTKCWITLAFLCVPVTDLMLSQELVDTGFPGVICKWPRGDWQGSSCWWSSVLTNILARSQHPANNSESTLSLSSLVNLCCSATEWMMPHDDDDEQKKV